MAQTPATDADAATGSADPSTAQASVNPDDVPIKDPESAEIELKITKDIMAMPDPVRDRFKALKVLTDQLHELDEEEDRAYREIERKYELLYGKVYAKRAALLKGDQQPDPATLGRFEEMKTALIDNEYEGLEIPICDVKDI